MSDAVTHTEGEVTIPKALRDRYDDFLVLVDDAEIALALAESESYVHDVRTAIERGATLDQVVRIFV